MFQTGVTEQIIFLIVMSLSLLIITFNYLLNRENLFLSRLASLFFIPFSIYLFLFFYPPAAFSPFLIVLTDALLSLGILLLFLFKTRIEEPRWLTWTALVVPCLVLPFVLFTGSRIDYRPLVSYFIYFNHILLIAGILVVFRSNAKTNTVLAGLFGLLVAQPLSLLADSTGVRLLYILSRLCAYGCFFSYVYRDIFLQLMGKTLEAERKLAEWEKSIKYEVLKRTITYEQVQQKLLDKSKIDGLTEAYNKIAILEIIAELISKGDKQPFTMLMLDIDHFKEINDTLGHLVGDDILREVSAIFRNSIRSVDSLGRYGGDEFIITLPRAAVKDAFYVAERIRSRVETAPDMNVTVSIGIASFPQDGREAAALIEVADQGLYLSKQKGRNTVSYAGAKTALD